MTVAGFGTATSGVATSTAINMKYLNVITKGPRLIPVLALTAAFMFGFSFGTNFAPQPPQFQGSVAHSTQYMPPQPHPTAAEIAVLAKFPGQLTTTKTSP